MKKGQSLLLVTEILHWNSHKIPGTFLLLDFSDSIWQQSTQLAFLTVNCILEIHFARCNKYWLRTKVFWDVTLCRWVTGSQHSFKTPGITCPAQNHTWIFSSFYYFNVVHSMNFLDQCAQFISPIKCISWWHQYITQPDPLWIEIRTRDLNVWYHITRYFHYQTQ
jgi:hypothetical protein